VLRAQIGTDKFWAGIREYYRRYRDANASTADFRRVMEEVSGSDLGWFFQQWIYRAGTPSLEGRWHYDAASKKVILELSQTQPGEPYRLPLEVAVGGKLEKIEMTGRQQRFELPADQPPPSLTLDPNTLMLMEAKLEGPPAP
jgi:aminopeptidase N